MLNNLELFQKFKDKILMTCLAIINLILTVAYMIEFIKGNRTIVYVLTFISILWFYYILAIILYHREGCKVISAWVFSIGFLVMYSFALFTSTSTYTWVYLFPFVCLLPLYYATLRIVQVNLIGFFTINAIDIIRNWGYYTSAKEGIVALEQRFACVILVLIYMYYVCLIIYRYTTVFEFIYREEVYDLLTGCHSEGFVKKRLAKRIENNTNTPFTLIYVDIDDFKNCNAVCGRSKGDKVLKTVADILRSNTEKLNSDTSICRFNGDRFFIFIMNRTHDEINDCYESIRDSINNIIIRNGNKELFVSATVSVTDTRSCGHSYQKLYETALKLMLKGKESGGNTVVKG